MIIGELVSANCLYIVGFLSSRFNNTDTVVYTIALFKIIAFKF